MANEQVPSQAPAPLQQWFARLGTSGKLLAIGGLAGVIVTFLPLVSVSMEMMGIAQVNQTRLVVADWRGKICLVGYLGALLLAFVLYPPNGLGQKALCWVGVGVGMVVVVLAIWLLVLVLDANRADVLGMASVKASVGIGTILNLLTGAAVVAGGFLKAREEKLI